MPRCRTPGRVGRNCLPRVAARQGRGGACPGGGPSLAGKRAPERGADPARHGGGQVDGCAGGQPAVGADPVQRGAVAAPTLCVESGGQPRPHPLPAGR